MAFGRRGFLACFELGEPGVGFGGGGVQAGGLVVGPGGEGVLMELLALLLAFYILFDGLTHDPVGRAAARGSEASGRDL